MFDLIIIGIGPGGLAASIYASRYRIKHLLIGKDLGGAMALSSWVENYPGFPRISGLELTQKMAEHAQGLGIEVMSGEVAVLEKTSGGDFLVKTEAGQEYQAKTLIIATGTKRRELGVPGEKEYLGRGVSYCTTCDAAFFKNKAVAVVGGANAAVMGAVHLAEYASRVYLIYRKKPLRAEPIWAERAENNQKIKVLYETRVTEILGDGQKVSGIKIEPAYSGQNKLSLEGIFIEAGGVPGTELVKPLGVAIDERGYIKVGVNMSTNVPGVFAAGDIANAAGELQQVVTAASEGAIAATSVFKYLQSVRSGSCRTD
jgi:thioredoxin reductase (NADPH)